MTCSSLALISWLQETQLKTRIYYNYVGVFIKGARPQQSLVSASIGWTPIRNRQMFSLGKMLLELAFHQSFQSLRNEEDADVNNQESTSDWFTVNRLLH